MVKVRDTLGEGANAYRKLLKYDQIEEDKRLKRESDRKDLMENHKRDSRFEEKGKQEQER